MAANIYSVEFLSLFHLKWPAVLQETVSSLRGQNLWGGTGRKGRWDIDFHENRNKNDTQNSHYPGINSSSFFTKTQVAHPLSFPSPLLDYPASSLISVPQMIHSLNLATQYANLLQLLISKQISCFPKLNGNQLSQFQYFTAGTQPSNSHPVSPYTLHTSPNTLTRNLQGSRFLKDIPVSF